MDLGGIRSSADIGVTSSAPGTSNDDLGKNAFLELMVAQFNNQNPLDPTKNEDFIAQLAQFSSLEGIQNLNTSVEEMAAAMRSNSTLQAAALVGRSVLAPASQVLVEDGGVAGNIVHDDGPGPVVVEISDAAGSLVRRLELGQQPAGDVRFDWNGTDDEGEQVPAGIFAIRAYAMDGDGPVQLQVELPERVVSVSFADNGTAQLNLSGGASVALNEIRELQ